jgi:hypothetical protein
MKKSLLIIGLAVGVIVLGTVAYFTFKKFSSPFETTTSDIQNVVTDDSEFSDQPPSESETSLNQMDVSQSTRATTDIPAIPSSFQYERKFDDKISGAEIIERKIDAPPPGYNFSEPTFSWIFVKALALGVDEQYVTKILGDVKRAEYRGGYVYLVVNKKVAKTAYDLEGRAFNSWDVTSALIQISPDVKKENVVYVSKDNSFGIFFDISPDNRFAVIKDNLDAGVVIPTQEQAESFSGGIILYENVVVIDLISEEQKVWRGDELAAKTVLDAGGDIPVQTNLYVSNLRWSSDSRLLSGDISLMGSGDPGVGAPPVPPIATSTFTINTQSWIVKF